MQTNTDPTSNTTDDAPQSAASAQSEPSPGQADGANGANAEQVSAATHATPASAPTEQTAETTEQSATPKIPKISAAVTPMPRGIGVAVTFDWALTAQMLFLIPLFVFGIGSGAQFATAIPGVRIAAAVLLLVPAALAFAFGEAVRLGWRPAWLLQIALNAALTVVGLFEAPGDIVAALHAQPGFFSGLVRLAVLIVIDPVIVVMLTRPATRAWIAHHTVAEARIRHGARWLAIVLPFVVLGGAAIAFGGLY